MYIVKWTKEFTSGPLKGIFYDSELDFNSLDSAAKYVNFLHAHKTIPVKPCAGIDEYICHLPRIVPS